MIEKEKEINKGIDIKEEIKEINIEIKKYQLLIPMNLSFFEGEKTEKATPRKKQKAREEGQVATSTEVGTAFLFIAMFLSLRLFASYMYERIMSVFNHCFMLISYANDIFFTQGINNLVVSMFAQIILIALPLLLVAMIIGFTISLVQVGWHPTTKPLMPKFSKLNPINGIKRLFSLRSLLELVKSLLKFAIIILVIYNGLKDEASMLLMLIDMEMSRGVAYIADLIVRLGINVGMAYLIIAAIDLFYTRYKHAKDLRMSKQEIKEEFKQVEGDMQVKARIKQKMREAAMRRMMSDVPEADVIITNPTHYAVAIRYDEEKSLVPIVVAKGADHLAKRIKEIANENNVTIVENKPLARTLYSTVDVGKEIPPELYAAVAEILAYVYKLKKIV